MVKVYAACAIIASPGLSGAAFAEEAGGDPADRIPLVKVVTAHSVPDVQARTFFGRVRARETVDLSFEVGGSLQMLDAVEGDRVAQGSVLARLDQAPFERALERAEIADRQAQRRLKRAASLMRTGAGSRVRFEDAESERDLAAVALREARDNLEDATLVAPFDSLVSERLTPNFSNVELGEPVLRLHDMSQIQVELELPERLLARVGDPSRIRFSTRLPDRPEDVALRFVEFHAQTDRVSQSYAVTLAFPAIDSVFLVPGASVVVSASMPVTSPGLALPASAILSGPDRTASVLVLESSDATRAVLRRHPVEVHSETGTRLTVTGLSEGAEVVAVGGHLLRDGQTVRRYTNLIVGER
ncbi:MAG: efflux RND transporter periplasmic adaptor subunit [Pseudomonadota bacterium]